MTSLDDRLMTAGHEVSESLASLPTGDVGVVVRRAGRRRTARSAGVLATALVVVIAALALSGRADRVNHEVDFAGGDPVTATTVGGDNGVAALEEVPMLALHRQGWQLLEATETSADGQGGAGAIPSRHLRYVNDGVTGGTGVVSLDLFGVPPGSFYETIVPLLSAADAPAVQIRGVEGRLETSDQVFAFAWRESGTTIAALSVSGVPDRDAALAIAEAFEPVSSSSWRDMVRQDTPADRVTGTTIG